MSTKLLFERRSCWKLPNLAMFFLLKINNRRMGRRRADKSRRRRRRCAGPKKSAAAACHFFPAAAARRDRLRPLARTWANFVLLLRNNLDWNCETGFWKLLITRRCLAQSVESKTGPTIYLDRGMTRRIHNKKPFCCWDCRLRALTNTTGGQGHRM